MNEICNECGHSVRLGSGRFVNRVPDLNKPEYRKQMRKPFPEGDFICAECEIKRCWNSTAIRARVKATLP
jgi:hypothetical protein